MGSGLQSSRSYLGGLGWKGLVRLGPFHWGAMAPWLVARSAFGVVVPFGVGAASGHLDYGAFAALGAFSAGIVSFEGVTRSRVAAVAVASVGMSVCTFVGAITVAVVPWLLVPVVMVLGYIAGLVVCLGPRLSMAVLQWPIALLIAVGVPFGPAQAALRAGLVLAGGLFQGVLVAGSWAFRRGEGERAALAVSYRSLAEYASALAVGRFDPPPPIAFPAVTILGDPNPLLPVRTRLVLLDLLEEAERLRAALAEQAFGGRAGDTEEAVGSLAAEAATVLGLVAGALTARRAEFAGRVREVNRRLAGLTVVPGAGRQWAGEALLGQLRAVGRLLARLDAVPVRAPTGDLVSGPALPDAQSGTVAALATLRANIAPSSEAARHALRLAVVAGLAAVMVEATSGLTAGRWVVMTIFLVLKPDYGSTLYRGVQRSVGTALGVGLGAAAIYLGYLHHSGLIAVTGACVAITYALRDVNYLLFSVFLTTYIVILLNVLGSPAVGTAEARLADTAIGAALALTGYFLWPTWEGHTAHEKFARLLETHGAYGTALLQQYARPGRLSPAQLRGLQAEARRARSDAEASTARLSDEPSHPSFTTTAAQALTAAVRRLATAELALHARLPLLAGTTGHEDRCGPSDTAARRLDSLATALDTTMSRLAASLGTGRPPQPLPALRPLQTALRDRGADATIVRITDELVDATDTIAAILRDHLPAPTARRRPEGT